MPYTKCTYLAEVITIQCLEVNLNLTCLVLFVTLTPMTIQPTVPEAKHLTNDISNFKQSKGEFNSVTVADHTLVRLDQIACCQGL